jgi:hypothetical protein
MHVTFIIPNLYDFVTKLCRQQATVILNHENHENVNIDQDEARHRNFKRLKLGGGQAYNGSIV